MALTTRPRLHKITFAVPAHVPGGDQQEPSRRSRSAWFLVVPVGCFGAATVGWPCYLTEALRISREWPTSSVKPQRW